MFAVVCVCAYDNEIASVNAFDTYKKAFEFMDKEATESYNEMKDCNSNIAIEFYGQRVDIIVNGNLDYFWTVEYIEFN